MVRNSGPLSTTNLVTFANTASVAAPGAVTLTPGVATVAAARVPVVGDGDIALIVRAESTADRDARPALSGDALRAFAEELRPEVRL